jgi:quinol monooxygenase YgiN
MDETLRIVALLNAKAGKEPELEVLLQGLIEPTRAEAGCIRYELHANNEDPGEFTFLEEWTGEEALAAHFESVHIRDALELFPDLLDGQLELRRLTQIG